LNALRIVIVTPAAPGTRHGNRSTALRWARQLRSLGHKAKVMVEWDGSDGDVMIALHARRSHASIMRWKRNHASHPPSHPLVLALTGTDLYRDLRTHEEARESLRVADRVIVLQPKGLEELDAASRAKTRVIFQSVHPVKRQRTPRSYFLVTVIGHLREEKDPFRAACALRHLPAGSRIRIVHLGGAMSAEAGREARALMKTENRYRWLGELGHAQAMRWLARSHAMVISSKMEGGAHVVSEAIAIGVPVIASDIAGNVGLLGEAYPGYFPVGNEQALAALLSRAETDSEFLHSLEAAVRAQRSVTDAAAEHLALARLLAELF
jgi:putative glycosyltransferase (TIGR04348 family)